MDVSITSVAEKLLQDNFLLTALEFHAELAERGRELKLLKDFFANPTNFELQSGSCFDSASVETRSSFSFHRSASQQTLDSIDGIRLGDDGNGGGAISAANDRIALLEFELRKAQETIKALRSELSVSTRVYGKPGEDGVTEAGDSGHGAGDEEVFSEGSEEEGLAPLESRALNSLVHEYLLKNGYKMASVAFAETADLLDEGDDRSLGVKRRYPKSLVNLFGSYHHGKHRVDSTASEGKKKTTETTNSGTQTTASFDSEPSPVAVVITDAPVQTPGTNPFDEVEVDIEPDVGDRVSDVASDVEFAPGEAKSDADAAELTLNNLSVNPASLKPRLTSSPFETGETGGFVVEKSWPVADLRKKCLSRTYQEELVRACVPEELSTAVMSSLVEGDLDKEGNTRVRRKSSQEIDSGSNKQAVEILAESLPLIVPNVILAKRQELIPLLLCGINYHSDYGVRDQLIHILFNLIKRPDSSQRNQILQGFLTLAKLSDPVRIEAEVLPQCWEQINHKHPERRLLVAECCSVLAPLVPAGIRNSLMLSMVLQLIEDRDEVVREVAVRSLAFIVALMSDASKYHQISEVVMTGLTDASSRVKKASRDILLPVFAAWAGQVEKLHANLVPSFMDQLRTDVQTGSEVMLEKFSEDSDRLRVCFPFLFVRGCWEQSRFAASEIEYVDRNGVGGSSDDDDVEDLSATQGSRGALCDVGSFPWMEGCPLTCVKTVLGKDPVLVRSVEGFFRAFRDEGKFVLEKSATIGWVAKIFVPFLAEISSTLGIDCSDAVENLVDSVLEFCRIFGPDFIRACVKPEFIKRLRGDDESTEPEKLGSSAFLGCSLPVYLAGVLFAFPTDESKSEVRRWTERLLVSSGSTNPSSLDYHSHLLLARRTFACLARRCPESRGVLVDTVWSLVTHPSPGVRSAAGAVLAGVVPHLGVPGDEGVGRGLGGAGALGSRIFPAMVTLVNDHNPSVKKAVIPAFGALLENTLNREILDKVYMQFHNLKDNPLTSEELEAQLDVVLIRTFGKSCAGAEAKFRDDVVLPWLIAQAVQNNCCPDDVRRRNVALALVEAFSSISCCFLRDTVVTNGLLPGIKCLIMDAERVAPECLESLLELKKEFESKSASPATVNYSSPQASTGFSSAWLSGAFAPKLANVSASLTSGRRSNQPEDRSSPSPGSGSRSGSGSSSSPAPANRQHYSPSASSVLSKLNVPKAQAISALFKKK